MSWVEDKNISCSSDGFLHFFPNGFDSPHLKYLGSENFPEERKKTCLHLHRTDKVPFTPSLKRNTVFLFNFSVFVGRACSKGFISYEKKDVQIDRTFTGKHNAADLGLKMEHFESGKEKKGKEKEIQNLLEETSLKISVRVKRDLSSKIFRHIRKIPVLLHYH